MMVRQNEGYQVDGELVDALFFLRCIQISDDYAKFMRRQVWERLKNLDPVPNIDKLNLKDIQEMLVITKEGNRMTPSAISDILRIDRSTVTRSIHKLEKMGLVRLEENATDLRSVDIIVTEPGLKLCREYRHIFAQVFGSIDSKYQIGLSNEEKRKVFEALRILSDRAARLSQEKRLLPIKRRTDSEIGPEPSNMETSNMEPSNDILAESYPARQDASRPISKF